MRKLKLDHEDLKVETFVPDGKVDRRGTVVGRDTYATYNYEWECQSYQETCYNQGCGTGLTSVCGTGGATDCPGQSECAHYTEGHTCANTCTDVQACTFCGAIC